MSPLRPRGLGEAGEVDELGTVTERVVAPGGLRQRDHVVVAEVLDVGRAAQQLPEACDRD